MDLNKKHGDNVNIQITNIIVYFPYLLDLIIVQGKNK